MSNRRIKEARLPGFHGPYFDGLEALQHLFAGDLQRMNEVFMSDVRKSFRKASPKVQRLVRTEDGYQWTFSVSFEHYGREACVLIPGVLDFRKLHGTHADRHVALYYKGEPLTPEELKRITRKATAAFEDTYERMYGHIA